MNGELRSYVPAETSSTTCCSRPASIVLALQGLCSALRTCCTSFQLQEADLPMKSNSQGSSTSLQDPADPATARTAPVLSCDSGAQCRVGLACNRDRKSTRLNSSHRCIS